MNMKAILFTGISICAFKSLAGGPAFPPPPEDIQTLVCESKDLQYSMNVSTQTFKSDWDLSLGNEILLQLNDPALTQRLEDDFFVLGHAGGKLVLVGESVSHSGVFQMKSLRSGKKGHVVTSAHPLHLQKMGTLPSWHSNLHEGNVVRNVINMMKNKPGDIELSFMVMTGEERECLRTQNVENPWKDFPGQPKFIHNCEESRMLRPAKTRLITKKVISKSDLGNCFLK